MTQEPLLCATALAAAGAGRTAILKATCAASDSGWARLVRAALREPSPDAGMDGDQGGYRDAPRRTTSETIVRVSAAELARIARTKAIGLGGVAGALVGAGLLIAAQPVVMALLMLAALACAWRVIVNGRSAGAALAEARRALPDLVAGLQPPPPLTTLAVFPVPSGVRLHTSVGILDGILVFGLGFCVIILVAGAFSEMHHGVPATQIGLLLGVHVMLLPLVLVLGVLLRRVEAHIEVIRDEIVLVHRVVGITYAQTIAPLEIVGRFFVEGARTRSLAIDTVHRRRSRRDRPASLPTPEQRILLAEGDSVEAAAAALNRALGRTLEAPAVAGTSMRV